MSDEVPNKQTVNPTTKKVETNWNHQDKRSQEVDMANKNVNA